MGDIHPSPSRPLLHDDGAYQEPVPTYTEVDDSGFLPRLDELQSSATSRLVLPITSCPSPFFHSLNPDLGGPEFADAAETRRLQIDIIRSFYSSIGSRRNDVVSSFISRGFVSPDVPNERGGTPLLAAVSACNPTMVRTLVSMGATIDGFGTFNLPNNPISSAAQRTPLQAAAALGYLPIVRLLMEEFNADDAIVAPDGAMALRLAAAGGHREVVEYLPLRRGGEWRRWKTTHEKEMAIVRKSAKGIVIFVGVFVWYIPKYTLYVIPKEIATGLWSRRHKMKNWCKRQVVEFPRRAKKAAKAVWRGIKKVPVAIKDILKSLWKLIKATPAALKIVADWIWTGIKKFGGAVANVGLRILSFLHTVITAIVDFFRGITLKDVWDGFCNVLHSIFIGLPQAIWSFICKFGTITWDVLEALLGFTGKMLWYIGYGIVWIVRFVPQRIGRIFNSMGKSIVKGFHEILVWYNPKRV
jgi:hypothetical protein